MKNQENNKVKYIITAQPKEQFNFEGESLGMSDKRALFYCPSIGRRRIYRNSIDNPQRGLKILSYFTKKKAQEICDTINEVYNDSFEVTCQEF